MDTLPFYIFLFIHVVSLVVGFGAVLATDFFGLMWMLKKVSMKTVSTVAHHTEKLIWLGWGGLVVSGVGLITIKGSIDNLTLIKLFFVAMIGVNGLFLHAIKKMSDRIGDGPMPNSIKFRVGLASLVSQLGWWGAMSIGFIHRHWRHSIAWPENPILYIVVISSAIILVGLIGVYSLPYKEGREYKI